MDYVSVSVPYPGAAPSEVESGIVEVIEDRLSISKALKKIESKAFEGLASVVVEVERSYDIKNISDKIQSRIDTIRNFPIEAEEPQIEEILIQNEVISLAVYGDTDTKTLKGIAEYLKSELNFQKGNHSSKDQRSHKS